MGQSLTRWEAARRDLTGVWAIIAPTEGCDCTLLRDSTRSVGPCLGVCFVVVEVRRGWDMVC